jgi:hypothetical protein
VGVVGPPFLGKGVVEAVGGGWAPVEACAARWRPCDREEAARVEGAGGRLVAGVLAGWRVLLVVAMAGIEACGCR